MHWLAAEVQNRAGIYIAPERESHSASRILIMRRMVVRPHGKISFPHSFCRNGWHQRDRSTPPVRKHGPFASISGNCRQTRGQRGLAELCRCQMCRVLCIIEKLPGQEEYQQHPPTCAKPSAPPHPLTGLWQPASTRPATLSPSHGPCSSGGAGRWLVTLASWKTAAVSGQLPRQGRPRDRHPLSLALSLSVLLVLLLSRCKQARQAGTSNCDLTDLPGRKGEGGESLVRWIRSQPFNP